MGYIQCHCIVVYYYFEINNKVVFLSKFLTQPNLIQL